MASHSTTRQPAITITPLHPDELDLAVAVLARGMRDNPLHIAAFGQDAATRARGLLRLLTAANALGWEEQMLVARDDSRTIVGVCGMSLPGRCQATARQQLRMAPAMLRLGPKVAGRVLRWFGAWGHHDPAGAHWHLGPVAVDAGLQGQGIGSRLLEAFCARADADAATVWLETDKDENVRFYQRFGFETVLEEPVLGTPSWYMIRQPRQDLPCSQ